VRRTRKRWRDDPRVGLALFASDSAISSQLDDAGTHALARRLEAELREAVLTFRLEAIVSLKPALAGLAPESAGGRMSRPLSALAMACLGNWPEGTRRFAAGGLSRWLEDNVQLSKEERRLRKEWQDEPVVGLALLLGNSAVLAEIDEEDRESLSDRLVTTARSTVRSFRLGATARIRDVLVGLDADCGELGELAPISSVLTASLGNWPEAERRFASGEAAGWFTGFPELVSEERKLRRKWKKAPGVGLALLLSHPRVLRETDQTQRGQLARRLSAAATVARQAGSAKTATRIADAMDNLDWLAIQGRRSVSLPSKSP
jgi:hypothetical protein